MNQIRRTKCEAAFGGHLSISMPGRRDRRYDVLQKSPGIPVCLLYAETGVDVLQNRDLGVSNAVGGILGVSQNGDDHDDTIFFLSFVVSEKFHSSWG